jgi:hypothetical protein
MASNGAVSQAGVSRLAGDAASQAESADVELATAPYEYDPTLGTSQGASASTGQASHPSAQRLAAPAWAGKTGTLNRAQAAQDRADVWVTVPVDKVETRKGSTTVSPVYASPTGYQSRPGESAGSIPPAMPVGHPY